MGMIEDKHLAVLLTNDASLFDSLINNPLTFIKMEVSGGKETIPYLFINKIPAWQLCEYKDLQHRLF